MVGHSRSQVLPVSGEERHCPEQCVVCGGALPPEGFQGRTGHYVLDLERGAGAGFWLTQVKHLWGEIVCPHCGHRNGSEPGRAAADSLWQAALSDLPAGRQGGTWWGRSWPA